MAVSFAFEVENDTISWRMVPFLFVHMAIKAHNTLQLFQNSFILIINLFSFCYTNLKESQLKIQLAFFVMLQLSLLRVGLCIRCEI